MTFNKSEQRIYENIVRYYTEHPEHYKKMVSIVDRKSKITTSLIEYFILTYAKNNSTMYIKSNNNFFIVYVNYKNFLNGYHKEYIDIFRRKKSKDEKDFFFTLHDITLKTRLAQLHFFKWVFTNEMIDYIENNFEDIDKAFEKHKKDKTKSKKNIVNNFNIANKVVLS